MNTFLELARSRYSCRSYQNRDIPNDILVKVLEAARIAPSAINSQPWYFIVIADNSLKKKITSCYARAWIESAPVIIVACGDHNKSWRRADGKDHCDIDIAIAVDHLMLVATEIGLATCWVCKFDAMKCASVMELPSNITPIALIPIGYPADISNPNRHTDKRKALNEIVFWDKINF